MGKLEEFLKKKAEYEAKIEGVKKRLGHPHLDEMSAHDLAESQLRVFEACLEDIEKEIYTLKIKNRKGRA